jgi:hypothetical protein
MNWGRKLYQLLGIIALSSLCGNLTGGKRSPYFLAIDRNFVGHPSIGAVLALRTVEVFNLTSEG